MGVLDRMQKSKEGDNPHARKKISADIFQSLLEATASVDDPNPLQLNWSISNNRMLFFREDLLKALLELYSRSVIDLPNFLESPDI